MRNCLLGQLLQQYIMSDTLSHAKCIEIKGHLHLHNYATAKFQHKIGREKTCMCPQCGARCNGSKWLSQLKVPSFKTFHCENALMPSKYTRTENVHTKQINGRRTDSGQSLYAKHCILCLYTHFLAMTKANTIHKHIGSLLVIRLCERFGSIELMQYACMNFQGLFRITEPKRFIAFCIGVACILCCVFPAKYQFFGILHEIKRYGP